MSPTRTTPARIRALSTLALCTLTALVLTSGCTTDPESDTTSTGTPSTPSAEEIQAAGEAAEAALRSWVRVSDECLADPPNTEPSCFDQVSIDQTLQNDHGLLASAQERGFHMVGQTTVEWVEIGDVDLDSIAQVEVTACVDWTDLQAVNSDGTLFVARPENTRNLIRVEVRNYAYPSPDGWRVGQDLDPEGDPTPC